MDFEQAKAYVQSLNRFGMKLGLERIERLTSLLGNPQNEFRSILVGGTNGKGSTSVMIGSVLKEAGYDVGMFSKPHLFDLRERISVNGENIPDKDFVRLVEKIKPLADKVGKNFENPTFFEFVTSLAFEYFREKKIDIAVLEVGLGGRLDATNVTNPEVSIITNVFLEHQDILGKTVEKIAKEKAGIIKQNGILVTGSEDSKVLKVLREVCRKRKARLIKTEKLEKPESSPKFNKFDFQGSRIRVPLGGRYQIKNIACAMTAISSLKDRIPTKAIVKGMGNVKWPGRFEIVNTKPFVLLDGAKDTEGLKSLMKSLDLLNYDRLYTVLGVSKDKMIPDMIKEITKKTDFFILTKHKVNGRGTDTETLWKETEKSGKPFLIFNDVKEAVKKAIELSKKNDLILVTGSLFTVAEARELWFSRNSKMGREFNENLSSERNE